MDIVAHYGSEWLECESLTGIVCTRFHALTKFVSVQWLYIIKSRLMVVFLRKIKKQSP